jgi:hypothetical protein
MKPAVTALRMLPSNLAHRLTTAAVTRISVSKSAVDDDNDEMN